MNAPRVLLVADPADDVVLVRRLYAVARTSPGIVVCQITPGSRDPKRAAWDVLYGLGKRQRHRPPGRSSLTWADVQHWLLAHRVREVVVLRAQHLRARSARDLQATAQQSGARLWLIHHDAKPPPTDPSAPPAAVTDMLREITAPPPPDRIQPPQDQTPLPEVDALTFRAACARELDPDDLARVETLQQQALATTSQWLDAHPRTRPGEIHMLAAITLAVADPRRRQARLRGLQLALALRGLDLNIDEHAHAQLPPIAPAADIDEQALALVCAPSDPIAAGRMLAALLTGLPDRYLALLDLGQITAAHLADIPTPASAQPILRALTATAGTGALFADASPPGHNNGPAVARRTRAAVRAQLGEYEPRPHGYDERRTQLQQRCGLHIAPTQRSNLVRRLIEEERILISRLSRDARRAAADLVNHGIAEQRNHRLRLHADARYSAYLEHTH